MENNIKIDLGQVAKDLKLELASVQSTIQLLDDDNTISFISRYRKDLTGRLSEEQVRAIADGVRRARQFIERKETILKSIESQEKLTPDLARLVQKAPTHKRLEDLFLPFKPKSNRSQPSLTNAAWRRWSK